MGIINNKKYNEHETKTPTFKRLNILPLNKLTEFAKLLLMHYITDKYAVQSFCNTWEPNNQQNIEHNLRIYHFIVPMSRIKPFKRSPLYTLPKLWNELCATKFQSNK